MIKHRCTPAPLVCIGDDKHPYDYFVNIELEEI